MKATWYNKPLPRMKPQPHTLSMMLFSRRKARERRALKCELLDTWSADLALERKFEENLVRTVEREGKEIQRVYGGVEERAEWGE